MKKLKDYEYYKDDLATVYCGDNRDIIPLLERKSIDLIVTDPPYPYEFINTFSDLSKFGRRMLKPERNLFCYSGQYHLPEVLSRLSENLTYRWTIALLHTRNTYLLSTNVSNGWKPIILMQNCVGKKKRFEIFQDTVKSSGVEKEFHEWGQSKGGIKGIILQFSKEGETILDPFLGGGTSCVVSKIYNRKSIGIELDEESCKKASERIHSVFKVETGYTFKRGKIDKKGFFF